MRLGALAAQVSAVDTAPNAFQAGVTVSCFDPLYFDPKYFDTCSSAAGGGGHRRGRRVEMPITDPSMHDDELALLLLEAA